MIREKIILFPVMIVITLVIIETAFVFFADFNTITFEKNLRSKSSINDLKENKKISSPIALGISGWGNDIFYDRSDIYDRWFNLTGIIQFESGRKAIINDEIVQKNEQVRGFSVEKITDNKVVLTRHEYQVTLNLEK
jgi:hypothetical protein